MEIEGTILGDNTLNILLHFSTTYLSKAGHSTPTVTDEYEALKPPAKIKLSKIWPFQTTIIFCIIFKTCAKSKFTFPYSFYSNIFAHAKLCTFN